MIHHDPEKTAFSREFFKLEQYVVNVSQESAFRLFLRSLYLPRLSLGSCKKNSFFSLWRVRHWRKAAHCKWSRI